jgi:hypothetical protein
VVVKCYRCVVASTEPDRTPCIADDPFVLPQISSYIAHYLARTISSILASIPRMQPTQPLQSGRPGHKPASSSTHAAIIVGVIIGALGILSITLFIRDRRRKRGVKKGFRTESLSTMPRPGGRSYHEKDLGLETGIIHEPLPVYQRASSANRDRAQPSMCPGPQF